MARLGDILSGAGGFLVGTGAGANEIAAEQRKREAAADQQLRGAQVQELLNRLTTERVYGLEERRAETAAKRQERAAELQKIPTSDVTAFMRHLGITKPTADEFERTGGIEDRPPLPPMLDPKVLTFLGPLVKQQEQQEALDRRLADMQSRIGALGAGGAPGVGQRVTIGGPQFGGSVSMAGPPHAIGPESSFVQQWAQKFQSQGLPPELANTMARTLWNDERYRSAWMQGAGASAGGAAMQLGPQGAVMPGAPIPPQPGQPSQTSGPLPARPGTPTHGAPPGQPTAGGSVAEALARNKARGTTAGENVPSELGQSLAALENGLRVLGTLQQTFSPEERARFVGVRQRAIQGGRNLLEGVFGGGTKPKWANPRYASFNTMVGQLFSGIFGEGGKQLTITEKQVLEPVFPSGRETYPGEFEAKLPEFERRLRFFAERRRRYGAMSREDLERQLASDAAAAGFDVPSAGRRQPPAHLEPVR